MRNVPDVRKAVKWNSPFYGIEGQGWFLSFHVFTHYVKVTFFRGTSLRPVRPAARQSKDARWIDIREGRARRGAVGDLGQAGGRAARLDSVATAGTGLSGAKRIAAWCGCWRGPVESLTTQFKARPSRQGGTERDKGEISMKIKLTTVYVDDQEKALRFYTEVLGFAKKADFSNGPYRWLTVASPEEPDGTELQLALNDNPAAKAYQQAMFQQGQPAVMFFTDDVKGDYERIKARGAEFTMPPTEVTGSTIAKLNDTCGNLVQSPSWRAGDGRQLKARRSTTGIRGAQ